MSGPYALLKSLVHYLNPCLGFFQGLFMMDTSEILTFARAGTASMSAASSRAGGFLLGTTSLDHLFLISR